MEKEILEIINNCFNCPFKKEYLILKKEHSENSQIINNMLDANVKLSDENKWLRKDIKILSSFIIHNLKKIDSLDENIIRIINENK